MNNQTPVFKLRAEFYGEVLRHYSTKGQLRKDSKILVLCSGELDRYVFEAEGFTNVTLSNLSHNLPEEAFKPFKAISVDAEKIECEDGEYEFCLAHAGLHHCSCPHMAIQEMYRVAEKGIIIVEPKDSWFSRLMVKLNFGQEYEVASTIGKEGFRGGGLRFGGIPNFVYRFNVAEVRKCLQTYSPYAEAKYLSMDRLRVNWNRLRNIRNPLMLLVAKMILPFDSMIERIRLLANITTVYVEKPSIPEEIFPWLKYEEGEYTVDQDWVSANYKKS